MARIMQARGLVANGLGSNMIRNIILLFVMTGRVQNSQRRRQMQTDKLLQIKNLPSATPFHLRINDLSDEKAPLHPSAKSSFLQRSLEK